MRLLPKKSSADREFYGNYDISPYWHDAFLIYHWAPFEPPLRPFGRVRTLRI